MPVQELLENLVAAAKAENWDDVDQVYIPMLAASDDADLIICDWIVSRGLTDRNPHVRDAAASLFTSYHLKANKVPQSLVKKAHDRLLFVMQTDRNPYARYRAAFALDEHKLCEGNNEEIFLLLHTLREASHDKDVGDMARERLKKY
jgi:hypothetical protein